MRTIEIPVPLWDSNLTTILFDLEKVRTKTLGGSVPSYIFFQLKEIFQILETLGSARIEGNNTTLSEYVENVIDDTSQDDSDKDLEIKNLESAIEFIEKCTDENTVFNRAYISEIHKILTDKLTPAPKGEGSMYPGDLRRNNVTINSSGHTPPDYIQLKDYFDSFVGFINQDLKEQYQLLMISIAHHRFEHIHPFDNGNGRMGRLLNYAFLIKFGFQVKEGRLINPSSVFYSDRDKYYDMLSKADSLNDSDILEWCEYFLLGLKNEIEKIDSLLDIQYVRSNILLPVIKDSLESKYITQIESKILEYLIKTDEITMKSEELKYLGITDSKKKSVMMSKLRDKKMIKSTTKGGRIYTINFANGYLLRSTMKALGDLGFISDFLNEN